MTTTYVATPNTDQLENAWWELMQGELGLAHNRQTRELMQMLFDHVRSEAAAGVPILDAEGEPLSAVSSEEMAKRMVAAYACLFYEA